MRCVVTPEVVHVVEAVGEELVVEESVEDVHGEKHRHNVQNLLVDSGSSCEKCVEYQAITREEEITTFYHIGEELHFQGLGRYRK
jgi:hypothetical protein